MDQKKKFSIVQEQQRTTKTFSIFQEQQKLLYLPATKNHVVQKNQAFQNQTISVKN